MTNYEHVRNMTEQELAEYINSVYLAGVYVGSHKGVVPSEEYTEVMPYEEWLKMQHE